MKKSHSTKLALVIFLLQCLVISVPDGPASAELPRTGFFTTSLLNDQQNTAQPPYNPLAGPNYPLIQDSYFTDDYGNILMTINVLGEVNKPGQIIVRENADFPTIFALAGGLKNSANLNKIIISRRQPDANGKQAYRLNLNDYYRNGDRYGFIALKPNDTVIIPEKRGLSLDVLSKLAGITLVGFDAYSVVH